MVKATKPITAALAAFKLANAAPTSAVENSLFFAAGEGRPCGPQDGGPFIMCPTGPEMLCCSRQVSKLLCIIPHG